MPGCGLSMKVMKSHARLSGFGVLTIYQSCFQAGFLNGPIVYSQTGNAFKFTYVMRNDGRVYR